MNKENKVKILKQLQAGNISLGDLKQLINPKPIIASVWGSRSVSGPFSSEKEVFDHIDDEYVSIAPELLNTIEIPIKCL